MATYWENSCSFGLRYVSWYEYLIVSFFFPTSVLGVGIFFLISPFPDLCLLVPFYLKIMNILFLETAVEFFQRFLSDVTGNSFYSNARYIKH